MAEILNGELVRNETTKDAMGGTEQLALKLIENVDGDLLKDFQIVSSRVRDLAEDKIRIFWAHDLPEDPESHFLQDVNWHNRFHKFVFVSNWQMQRYIERYRIPWSKCIVLQNAIDPIPEHTKPDVKDGINLIYFSTPHRGLNIAASVVDKLAEKYKVHFDVYSSFKLYGWDVRDKEFEPLFNMIDDHPNMTNHGTVDNSVIREALQKAHVLVYPSTWQETSCLVLMESMSAELTCVHSNYAALYETAANLTTMYQFNEDVNKHANQLYTIMDTVLSNLEKGKYIQDTKTAKGYADYYYSWTKRSVEWTSLLKALKAMSPERSVPKEVFAYRR